MRYRVLANIPAAIVVSLNLNNVMNTMLNTPASVFTTVRIFLEL